VGIIQEVGNFESFLEVGELRKILIFTQLNLVLVNAKKGW
jgi:hypothetical protein